VRVLLAFIEPTRLKLLFLAEWALYLLFALARRPSPSRQFLVGAAPFAFHFLVGCTLVALSRRMRPIVGGGRLLACALVPVLLDQSAKALVGATMPPGGFDPAATGLAGTHARRQPRRVLAAPHLRRAPWCGRLEQSWSLVRDVTRFGWRDLRRLVRGAGLGDDHKPV